MSARVLRRREHVVAEVEFLLTDRSPDDVAAALGYAGPGSIARALYRAGRPDLARPFNNADWQAHRAASLA